MAFFLISLGCLEVVVGCDDFMFLQAMMLILGGLFFLLLTIIDYTYN